MAKVWHTSSKYDLINMITKDEAGSIQTLVSGRKIEIRNEMGDTVPLSLFRVVKSALAITKNSSKALYEAGQFIAKRCLISIDNNDPKLILEQIKRTFNNLNIGKIYALQINPTKWILKLEESATAYGTIVRGSTLCHFEAGIISGIIQNAIKKKVLVQETECIGTGKDHCEFLVTFSK